MRKFLLVSLIILLVAPILGGCFPYYYGPGYGYYGYEDYYVYRDSPGYYGPGYYAPRYYAPRYYGPRYYGPYYGYPGYRGYR